MRQKKHIILLYLMITIVIICQVLPLKAALLEPYTVGNQAARIDASSLSVNKDIYIVDKESWMRQIPLRAIAVDRLHSRFLAANTLLQEKCNENTPFVGYHRKNEGVLIQYFHGSKYKDFLLLSYQG